MIKKITNWTFGSVFRTLGRVLAYVLLLSLLVIFSQKNGIKWTDLIGIDIVNASTIQNWSTKQVKIYTCHSGDCAWSNNYDSPHEFSGSDMQYPVHAVEWRVKASNGLSIENSYTFSFGYKPTPDAIAYTQVFMRKNAQSSKESITCTTSMQNDYYMWNCTFTPQEDYSSSEYLYIQIQFYDEYLTKLNAKISGFDERLGTNAVITQQTNNIINSFTTDINNLKDALEASNQALKEELQDLKDKQSEEQQVCKIITTNYDTAYNKKMLLNNSNGSIASNNFFNTTDYIAVNNKGYIKVIKMSTSYLGTICFYNSDKEYISCTNSQNMPVDSQITIPSNTSYIRVSIHSTDRPVLEIESCQNGNQGILDTLNDDSIDDHKLEDILDDLPQENESYLGPLTSFLVMPLTWVQSLLASNQSCSDLHLPLPFLNNKYLDLPCMTEFWNSMGAIKTLIELVWIAVVCSRVFNQFYKITIEAVSTNPDSYDKLTALKQWEL